MLPLTAIICTHHREEAVAETLALLFGPRVQSARSIDLRVILVDQGRTLQRTDFPADWNLHIVHQDNFGGAGGFTRGMIEAMDEGAGWILLMDDDATPDPASFPILADYIRSREPETRFAVHGTMFSTEEPQIIYEAGAWIKQPKDSNFDIVQRLRGYKPSKISKIDPALWEKLDIDYGAWWFFCVHTDSIRAVGLPLPLFIRGDDREYGLRLQSAGIRTIPLPGLRVWHPAHANRLNLWHTFFDWRNNLIIHSLQSSFRPVALIRTFAFRAFTRILAGQYDESNIMIESLRHFLRGPDCLRDSPQDLLAIAKSLDVSANTVRPAASVNCLFLQKITTARLARTIIQIVLLNGLFIPKRREKTGAIPTFPCSSFDWLATYRLGVYALHSPSDNTVRLIKPRLRDFICSSYRLLGMLLLYLSISGTVAKRYKEAFKELTGPSFWKKYLRLKHS